MVRGAAGWPRPTCCRKVDALDAGADDYVTKPFGVDELLARIRAVTRRSANAGTDTAPTTVHIGQNTVDLVNRTVSTVNGDDIRLTPTEWHLLDILARNPDKLVSQRQLLQEVWGEQYLKETNYLRQYLVQLRRKLEQDPAHPRHLLTEPGMGYRFRPASSDRPLTTRETEESDLDPERG